MWGSSPAKAPRPTIPSGYTRLASKGHTSPAQGLFIVQVERTG